MKAYGLDDQITKDWKVKCGQTWWPGNSGALQRLCLKQLKKTDNYCSGYPGLTLTNWKFVPKESFYCTDISGWHTTCIL